MVTVSIYQTIEGQFRVKNASIFSGLSCSEFWKDDDLRITLVGYHVIKICLDQSSGLKTNSNQGSRLTFQLSSQVASERFDFTDFTSQTFLLYLILCSICLIFGRVKYCKHASL